MLQTAAAILILPLLAFLVIVFVTWRQPATFDWTWLTLFPGGEAPGGREGLLPLGIQVDPLVAIMLIVVTVVSFLVQVYSRTYMAEHGHLDPGYSRFFAYLSLFTFSMLAVVLADNMLFFFIGWELVGLCSYLLIGL